MIFGLGKERNKLEVAEHSNDRHSITFITCLLILSALLSLLLIKVVGSLNSGHPQSNGREMRQYVELLRGQNNLVRDSTETTYLSADNKSQGFGTLASTYDALKLLALVSDAKPPEWISPGVEEVITNNKELESDLNSIVELNYICARITPNKACANIDFEKYISISNLGLTEPENYPDAVIARRLESYLYTNDFDLDINCSEEKTNEWLSTHPTYLTLLATINKTCWEQLDATSEELMEMAVSSLNNGEFESSEAYLTLSELKTNQLLNDKFYEDIKIALDAFKNRIETELGEDYYANAKPLRLVLFENQIYNR